MEALRPVEKKNDKITSENSSVTGGVLGATCLDSAFLMSENGHVLLLYTEAAAPHTRDWK